MRIFWHFESKSHPRPPARTMRSFHWVWRNDWIAKAADRLGTGASELLTRTVSILAISTRDPNVLLELYQETQSSSTHLLTCSLLSDLKISNVISLRSLAYLLLQSPNPFILRNKKNLFSLDCVVGIWLHTASKLWIFQNALVLLSPTNWSLLSAFNGPIIEEHSSSFSQVSLVETVKEIKALELLQMRLEESSFASLLSLVSLKSRSTSKVTSPSRNKFTFH